RRYLAALASTRLGVVEVRDGGELLSRLHQLATVFPASPVVVAVPTRKTAWRIMRSLAEVLGEPVGLVTARSRRPGRRCTVCTYRSLARVRGRDRAVLAVVEAERAAPAAAPYALGEGAPARVYGFVYAGVSRDEFSDLHLRALAGEVIHSVPSP